MGSCASKQCGRHKHQVVQENMENSRELRKQQLFQRSLSTPGWSSLKIPIQDHVDVVFHVGQEPEVWRIPAQKDVLSRSNPVFHAMFYGKFSQSHLSKRCHSVGNPPHPEMESFVDPDVDGRAFTNLIHFLYEEKIELRSVPTAVETLHAAEKYLCDGLKEICVKYLADQLTTSNVLQVLQQVLPYAPEGPSLRSNNTSVTNYHPTAPSQSEIDGELNATVNWFAFLVDKCLHFIDQNASAILASEDFELLPRNIVGIVVGRDELYVKDEREVLNALRQWSVFECFRRQLDSNPDNERNCLGDLLFQVRYLVMADREFYSDPNIQRLLTAEEIQCLGSYLTNSKVNINFPSHIQNQLATLTKKRYGYLRLQLPDQEQNPLSDKPLVASHKKRAAVAEKLFVFLSFIFE